MKSNSRDRRFMKMAMLSSREGVGGASPNPLVGAVVAREDQLVAVGHHHKFGNSHAEILALRKAGSKGRGATLYTTLEPCAHSGKTPPCVDAIISSGIRRVVSSMRDPDVRVAGRGFQKLRRAGIRVAVGLGRSDAENINWAYLLARRSGRSAVVAKIAMSLDGKIALPHGRKVWISGPASRKAGHVWRVWADGILVGVETVIRDNPILTARGSKPSRNPRPIIIDPMLRVPLNSKCLGQRRRPILVCSKNAPSSRRKKAEAQGVHVLPLSSRAGTIPFGTIAKHLLRLDIGNLLVEGGGKTLYLAMRSGKVDRFILFLAPKTLGEDSVAGMPGGWGQLKGFEHKMTKPMGKDLMLEYAREGLIFEGKGKSSVLAEK